MKKRGTIKIIVKNRKWYETSKMAARRSIRNLRDEISINLKKPDLKLKTDTTIVECENCRDITLNIHWKVVDDRNSNKFYVQSTKTCRYCWFMNR